MSIRAAPTMHGPAYVLYSKSLCVLLLYQLLLLYVCVHDEHVLVSCSWSLYVCMCLCVMHMHALLLGLSCLPVCLASAYVSTYPGGVFQEKFFFNLFNCYSLSKTPTKSISDFGRRNSPSPKRPHGTFREKIKMGPIRNPFHVHLTQALQDRL